MFQARILLRIIVWGVHRSVLLSTILLMLCDALVPHFFVCILGDSSSQFDSSQALRFHVSSNAGLDWKTAMHVGVVLFFVCRLLGRPCLWRRSGVSAASGTLRHAFVPVFPLLFIWANHRSTHSLIPSFCHNSLPRTVVFQTRPKSVWACWVSFWLRLEGIASSPCEGSQAV